MRLSAVLVLLANAVVLCGCHSESPTAPAASSSGENVSNDSGSSAGNDSVAPAAGAPTSGANVDSMSVEATPAREFTLSWVGNISALDEDPMDQKQVTIRGQVARVTSSKWFHAKDLESREGSVWLYGESLNWAWLNETWLDCEFEDATAIEKLQPGQTVVIEGRYVQSPEGEIRIEDCRLLAAGKAPEAGNPVKLLSMKEWQDAAKQIDEFSAENKQPLRLIEMRGFLGLELEEELFSETGDAPHGVLDPVAAFPIDEIKCPGSGAKAILTSLEKFPRLRALTFEGELNCEPQDLKELEQAQHLTSLTFYDCDNFNDDDVAALSGLTLLRELNLDGGFRGYELTDKSVEAIAKLNELRSLTLVYQEGITDHSLPLLAGLPHLRNLTLRTTASSRSEAGLTDAGLAALPEGSFPELLFLSLENQHKISDAGIKALIKLKLHLASLYLYGTAVTDAGLVRIIDSKLTDRISALPNEPGADVRQKLIDAKTIRDK